MNGDDHRGTPRGWQFLGVALERGASGDFDAAVTGDPCIVWDEVHGAWRMFYFAQRHVPGGERNTVAQAHSVSANDVGAGAWRKLGPVRFTNPGLLPDGQTHKPWVLMDPHRPNHAAVLDGQYLLFTVSYVKGHKMVQLARSPALAGPWKIEAEPVLSPGGHADRDGWHVDTVTAYWFTDRQRMLLFYKAYPAAPRSDQPGSPWGSSLCAAEMGPSDRTARKLGVLVPPSPVPGHWMSGWASGLQLVPARGRGWLGLMTGSPTPPAPVDEQPRMREPAPSLGGWAYSAAAWPVEGWSVEPRPIRWIDEVPEEARRAGVGTNLWRHHLLLVPGRREDGGGAGAYLYHNSGAYGDERLYVWAAR